MDDLPVMLKIYQHARELMAANGNPTQWGNTFPREEVILDDIRQQRTMLLVDEADGKERVLAQFALCTGEDPTYAHIDGAWLDDDSYVTIHRIASSGASNITATCAPTRIRTTRPCSTCSNRTDSPAAA